jgi:hypothetical protein
LNPDAAGVLAVSWPLSAAEAAGCLHEAEEWAHSGLTGAEARSRHSLARAEEAVRQEYRAARDMGFPSASRLKTGGNPDRESLREAQRFLLFAWAQEERLLELRRLAERSEHEARQLQDALRDADEMEPARSVVVPDFKDEAHLVPDWKQVLERLALFLPLAAVLCARDARVIEALHDAGLCCRPPESGGLRIPAALSPLAACADARLLGERLPMWRILGYTQAQEGRPWLDVERLFLLAVPDDGPDNGPDGTDGTDAHA